MALRLTVLEPEEQGRRLRRLRLLAQQSLEVLATEIGYGKGGNSSLSLIERGMRKLNDVQRRKAINFLAGKGELVDDASILYRYLMGDHDSVDACLNSTGRLSGGSTIPGSPNTPVVSIAAKLRRAA